MTMTSTAAPASASSIPPPPSPAMTAKNVDPCRCQTKTPHSSQPDIWIYSSHPLGVPVTRKRVTGRALTSAFAPLRRDAEPFLASPKAVAEKIITDIFRSYEATA
jgi:hypothetical protein